MDLNFFGADEVETAQVPLQEPDTLGKFTTIPQGPPQPALSGPVSFGVPLSSLMGTDTSPAPQVEDPVVKWQQESRQRIDKALLGEEDFFKDQPVTWHPDPERAKLLAINEAYLTLRNGGQDLPDDDLSRSFYRQQIADEDFGGKGGESDEAFYAEMKTAAQGRKDVRVLEDEMDQAVYLDAVSEEGSPNGYAVWRETAKTKPGFKPDDEPRIYAAWKERSAKARQLVAAFRPELSRIEDVFKKDEGVTVEGYKIYQSLEPEQREEFLKAVGVWAKAQPKEKQGKFWANVSRSTGMGLADFTRQAGEGVVGRSLGQPAYRGPSGAGSTAGVSEEDRQATAAEFRGMRNFASKLRNIERTDYRPIVGTDGARGDKIGFWESAAYQTPSTVITSLSMAVPVVGPAVMMASMEGQAYDDMRDTLKRQGLDEDTASAYAEQLAPYIMLPQAGLEKIGFDAWAKKVPGLGTAIDSMTDGIKNQVLRFVVKAGAIGLAETAVEDLQGITPGLVQMAVHKFDPVLPGTQWTGKGGVFDGFWTQTGTTFVTMFPLALLGAAGGLNQEARHAALQKSPRLWREAMGYTKAGNDAIDTAKTPSQLAAAVELARTTRAPNSEEAKAAVQKVVAQQEEQRAAARRMSNVLPIIRRGPDGFTVIDAENGDPVGEAKDWRGAMDIANTHFSAMEDLDAERLAHLESMLDAGQQVSEAKGEEAFEFDLGRLKNKEDLTPQELASFQQEVVDEELVKGGTGEVARTVLGMNVPAMIGTIKGSISKLFQGSDIRTVAHEFGHSRRRAAYEAGILNRDMEISLFRAIDAVYGGRDSRYGGGKLRLLPDIKDADLTDKQLSEASSKLFEMEILRTRKAGKRIIPIRGETITKNLSAIARLAGVENTQVYKSFVDASRKLFGLTMERTVLLKNAARKGKFDMTKVEEHLHKLMGTTAQAEHETAVAKEAVEMLTGQTVEAQDPAAQDLSRAEFNRVFGLPEELEGDDIPLSLGTADVANLMAGNALARIKSPSRRINAMSRMARDFEAISLTAQRMTALFGRKVSKYELRQAANAREDLAVEEKLQAIHAKYGAVLKDEGLSKIKSQPVHAALADPNSPLKGRLMSKAQAIREFPDEFQLHRLGDYSGAEKVSRTTFGGDVLPHDAAIELYDAGLIREPTAAALWEGLLAEQQSVAGVKEILEQAEAEIRAAKKDAKREANEWLATQARSYSETSSLWDSAWQVGKGPDRGYHTPREEVLRALRMLDAIVLALPVEIRGAVGGYTQIAMIKTPEGQLKFLKDKIEKADKALEGFLREQFGKEFESLLARARPQKNEPGQKPQGSIDPEAWDILSIAERAAGMGFKDGEKLADSHDAIADDPETSPDAAEKNRTIAQLIRLTMNWDHADAARREQAVVEMDKIYLGGRLQLAIQKSQRFEQLDVLRQDGIKGIGRTGHRMERRRTERAAKGSKAARAAEMAWEFMSFGQVVNVIFGEDSKLAQWFNARELAASNALEDAMQAKENGLEAVFDTMAGNRFDGPALRHRLATEDAITIIDGRGKEQTFTEAEMISFLLMWRQADGRRHMEGYTAEDGPASEWSYTEDNAKEVESGLSREGLALYIHIANSYATEYSRINDVFRRVWNMSMPRHKNYAPLTVLANQTKNDITDPISGEVINGGLTPSSLKNRSSSAIAEPDFRDAFTVYLQHARQMEHFIAYAEFTRDAIAIINRRDARNAIKAGAGPYGAAQLSKWVDYFARGGLQNAEQMGAVSTFFAEVFGNLTGSMLTGRISVLMMQSLQLAAAPFKMPMGAFLTRLAKLPFGQLGWSDAIHSAYIQRRLEGQPPAVRDAMMGLASGTPNRIKWTGSQAALAIPWADARFTAGTYAILYDYHLKNAKALKHPNPEAFAHAEAERLTDQIAQPQRQGAKSWIEVKSAGQPAWRTVFNFASDPRQKASLAVYEMMRHDKAGKAKAAKVARALALYWLGSGVAVAVLRAIARDLRSDEDKEILDERHWSIKRLGMMAMAGPLGAVPILGSVAEESTYAATGQFLPSGGMWTGLTGAAKLPRKWFVKGDFDPLEDAETIFNAGAGISGTVGVLSSAMHLVRDLVGIAENIEGPD